MAHIKAIKADIIPEEQVDILAMVWNRVVEHTLVASAVAYTQEAAVEADIALEVAAEVAVRIEVVAGHIGVLEGTYLMVGLEWVILPPTFHSQLFSFY
jgi:hypothetical protein